MEKSLSIWAARVLFIIEIKYSNNARVYVNLLIAAVNCKKVAARLAAVEKDLGALARRIRARRQHFSHRLPTTQSRQCLRNHSISAGYLGRAARALTVVSLHISALFVQKRPCKATRAHFEDFAIH